LACRKCGSSGSSKVKSFKNLNKRHKELLERQHFGGPFWENKKAPKSVSKELPDYEPEEFEQPNISDIPDIPTTADSLDNDAEEFPDVFADSFMTIKR
jgi:hypothetical protein